MIRRSRTGHPIADTTTGPVRGKARASGRIADFRGIPYAAPPVGERRWKPPVAPEPWKRTKQCTRYGKAAYQRGLLGEVIGSLIGGLGLGRVRTATITRAATAVKLPQSEDCLTLNVRAPMGASKRPVMVWIHGGDHTDGSSQEPLYRTDVFAERGAVFVTINYRLGLFGFFAHPELAAESADAVSGNYGLLDQIAALEWVRDNIANFGGDPGNVTIFGESAGGEAVLNLMTSPRARGLFHRAIAQSPSDSARWLHLRRPVLDFDAAEDAGAAFAASLVGDDAGQLKRLRELDADSLIAQYRDHWEHGRHFYPAVDGVILPTTPMSAFLAGEQAGVPLIIGYNADEATMFADMMHPAGSEFASPEGVTNPFDTAAAVSPADARTVFERSYPSAEHVDRLLGAYPGLAGLDQQAVLDHLRDHMFGVHVDLAARRHAECGYPVYRYFFTAMPPSKKQTVGAFHGAEILYVMDTTLPLVPEADAKPLLAREMGDRWYAFAASGSPDHPGHPLWPKYDPGAPQHLVLDLPNGHVAPCPPQPGLDLMRERAAWLSSQLVSNATTST